MNPARASIAELAPRVGQEIGVSTWIQVDQARIDEFAHCTGDDQWIHVDVERATRESPYRAPIAHGYLTLSLLAPTGAEVLIARIEARQFLNYGLDKVRFLAPVRAGQRVRNRVKLVAVEDKGDGRWLLTTENTVEIDGEAKPALIATALALVMT
ncbi:MAG: MaoC family dehydratase [Burkholderiales bacterium]|nr:MaoC family dehydratase [Burkholderiales bacterium]MDE1927593.1 MaoC family dehydratase [Burkholderiales bacterium]MDE2161256.1 MaoC family dehydratase [Burkholderiales bacterium]MDE2505177.1 MaoC family dehydratase [Burkholderiales bacterium]